MQRKFKVVEPKKDISIANWVAVSSDSQNISIDSPRVTLSSRPIEQSVVTSTNNDPYLEINTTPKSIKILRSAVFFKDDAPHKARSSKRKSNANKIGSVQASTTNFDFQNVTPKVIFSPGIIRDTKAWRTDPTKCFKEKQNLVGVTYRSFTSGSGTDRLDSSRILFKAEIHQNSNNVNNWVSVVSESKTVSEDDFRIPPTFSARTEEEYLKTENMSEAMSKKVGENKKEIEKLKTELETLINTNLKNKNVISQLHLDNNIENVPSSINLNKLSSAVKQNVDVSPSKTSISPVSVRRKSSAVFSDIKEEPKSKAKTYDPESTREFIRKQKLRRKEKLQQEELKKKESEELKKHKLEELKQKTLQLLTENVKKSSNKKICAKPSEEKLACKLNSPHVNNNKSSKNLTEKRKVRARSFDFEKIKNCKVKVQENVDKTKENLCRRSRSVSREQKFCDTGAPLKTRRSVRENKPNSTNMNSNPEKELEQVVNQISNLLNNKTDNIEEKAATKIQAAFRSYQKRRNVTKPVENIPNKLESNTAQNIKNISYECKVSNEVKSDITSEIIAQNAPPPKDKINIPSLKNDVLVKSNVPRNIGNVEKLKTKPGEIIKSTNNSQSRNQKDDAAINEIIYNTDATFRNEDTVKEIEIIKQKLETSISQSNVEKRNETPDWLLPPSTLPYPYNFISAVKKKLEIATKSHSNIEKDSKLQNLATKDTSIQTLADKRKSNVSVQCSIEYSREIKESSISEVVPPKPEELKTFMSHKCRKQLVYNSPPKLKSPTNLKDIDQNIKRNKEKEHISAKSNSKTIVTSEASDSDTTKNIPEISEEEQFSKQYSVELDMYKNVKNITFDRPRLKHKISINNEKNFTIDQIKVDKNSSNKGAKKVSTRSENSDKLQNIIFDRRIDNSSSDINNLIKPDCKMDTSKISRRSFEQQSNRSKYPSDIDSILSQYSKMKSSSIHNDSHNSQYSADFNSSPTNHLSLPKSSSHQIQQEKASSLDRQSDTKSRQNISKERSSDLSKIKSDILASLARECSSSMSKISESLGKPSEITTNKSSGIHIESLNNIPYGSHINIKKPIESTSDNLTGKYTEFTSKNTENSSRNSTNNDVESLSKISSKLTEVKTRNSDSNIKEFSNKYLPQLNTNNGELKFINSSNNHLPHLDKKISILNSNMKDTKTENSVSITESHTKRCKNTKSDVSEMISKNNYLTSNSFEINTNPSNISHSKKEASIASSIPENSIALTTDSESAQESNIIKSSIDKSLKKGTGSVMTDSIIQTTSDRFEHSESKSGLKSSNIKNLSKPTVNLKIEKERFFRETKNNPNQIHLKFQAEVHLLNSFNNSLQQVVAVEKSLLDMHDPPPGLTVNFTRGCGAPDHMESLSVLEPSVCSQDFQMSHLSNSVASETAAASNRSVLSETCSSMVSHRESAINKNPYVGISLGMFDQIIRDEDNRFEHLKAILKLRDKALFDRTKGEIVWLEIQKKQLRENGQLNDVTVIKKKQRGLIIKLEQERHEMQRLKQAHKQAAKERKNALREQKNIIKQQLSSTDQIPTKIRRLSHLERRNSGPVKVYRVESKTEHVRETTMSRNNSGTDETISVTTSSVVTQISEKVSLDHSDQPEAFMALKPYPKSTLSSKEKAKNSDKHSEKVKRALLMKEADLEKRRKEAEELLKWHERLKQEEAQVVELERQAKSIQLDDHEKKRVLTGAQLNKIWKGITGSAEKKFDDHKKYQMSKRSLDKFYQNARKIFKEISEERNSSKRASEESYTSDFDASHSPSKINLSSSIMTQINETDLSISPNKMLSEKLRKISESSRLSFITSSKADTNISEHTTISEESQLPADKMSVVSEILFVDQQNETDSKTQTGKGNAIHSVGKIFSSKSSVISELNGISDHESVISNQSFPFEVESRKSSTDCDIPESRIISDFEQIEISDVKESIQSNGEHIRNSSTDSDLPELQIVSDHEHHSEKYKSAKDKESIYIIEEVSKKYNTNSDLSNVEISSEYDINSEHIKSTDVIESVLSFDEKYSKNTDIQINYENNRNSEVTSNILESIQSGEENKSAVISELSQLQNISHQTKPEISGISSEVSKFKKEYEENKSSVITHESQIVESLMPNDELYQTDIKTAEQISIIPEDNLTPTKDTNNSIKEIYSSELVQQISSENSSKTIEDNTSKIIDENILLLSDSHVLSDIEIKPEIDDTNRKIIISAAEEIEQNSSLDDSITVKSSYLQESGTIQSRTIVDENKNDSDNNLIESRSEIPSVEYTFSHDSYTAEPRSVLSETLPSKLIQYEKEFSIENSASLDKSDTIEFLKNEPAILKSSSEKQSTDVCEIDESTINDSKTKLSFHEESDIKISSISDKCSNSLTQHTNAISESAKECVDSENKSKVDELEIKTTSSIFESEEIKSKNIELSVASSEITIVESKSKNEVEENTPDTQNTLYTSDSLNSDIDKKLKPEFIPITDLQIKVSEIREKNVQSEISTPRESKPYYQPDFENISDSDFTTETNRQTRESDEEIDVNFEKDMTDSEAIENTESVKSSNTVETEKESITKIESHKSDDERNSVTKDNSETFESEKESTTIIESPKSHQLSEKENDISELKSEVAVSPKSVSTTEVEESIEDINEISELQIEDTNVAGVSHIDVRKRVSEILADTTISRGDKSPRLQDLYVTTYDILTNSAESTPETGSPTNEFSKRDKPSFPIEAPYRSEAEELLRKQLEIEQEIKQLERQQQQQNIPYLFMREIPNKPPPPYKPPNATVSPVINSVIPVHADQIKKYVNQSADVLFQAYVNGSIRETFCKSNEDEKVNSQKFIFDLCKEIALEVCKPIENTRVPSWKTQKNKFQSLISNRPLNKEGLCSVMNRKVLQLLNFEPIVRKDNLIIRWSRKKRDHVDEILVLESQTEEAEWTNYDSDEQTIKDNMTSDIMDMLILETAQVMSKILKKNKKMSWINYC